MYCVKYFALTVLVDSKSAPKKGRRLAVRGCIGGTGILCFQRGHFEHLTDHR
jgi:hypothetical protein